MAKTASIVMGGRITDLERTFTASSTLSAVLWKDTPDHGYVRAAVEAIHTYKCAKRMGIHKPTGKPCSCGVEMALERLLQ